MGRLPDGWAHHSAVPGAGAPVAADWSGVGCGFVQLHSGGVCGRVRCGEGGDAPARRNHNLYGFSRWMAGGGRKTGVAHGETEEVGFEAVVHKVHAHDIHATILHRLGIDRELLTCFHQGRRESLTDVHGKVVEGILA